MTAIVTTVTPDPNGTWIVEEITVDSYTLKDSGALKVTVGDTMYTYSPAHWHRIAEDVPRSAYEDGDVRSF